MKLLLDTHLFIWLATDQEMLSSREKRALTDGANEVLLSAISIWEIRVKALTESRRGRRGVPILPHEAIAWTRDGGLSIAVPTEEDYAADLDSPLDHYDPFDEMLLVHAQRLGARLLTRDSKLLGHPLAYSL